MSSRSLGGSYGAGHVPTRQPSQPATSSAATAAAARRDCGDEARSGCKVRSLVPLIIAQLATSRWLAPSPQLPCASPLAPVAGGRGGATDRGRCSTGRRRLLVAGAGRRGRSSSPIRPACPEQTGRDRRAGPAFALAGRWERACFSDCARRAHARQRSVTAVRKAETEAPSGYGHRIRRALVSRGGAGDDARDRLRPAAADGRNLTRVDAGSIGRAS